MTKPPVSSVSIVRLGPDGEEELDDLLNLVKKYLL